MNKISTIFNLGKHEESGPYWVFIFTDINEGFLFHYDSAANKTSPAMTDLLNLTLQQPSSFNIRMKYKTTSWKNSIKS